MLGAQPAWGRSQVNPAASPVPLTLNRPEAIGASSPTSLAPPSPYTIHLKSREFQPTPTDFATLQKLARSDRASLHVLVQLDFVPRQAAKDELKTRGLNLLAYVPDYAWIASVPASNPATVMQLPGVVWAGELTVEDKLDPAILKGEWGGYNFASDGTAAVYVAMHLDETLDTGRALVAGRGGKVTGEVKGINLLMVEMPRENIRALAAEDAVQWIEPAEPALGESNDGIRQRIGVDTVQAAPYNLSGAGVDILIYDSGIVTPTHPDFTGRLTIGAGEPNGVSDHSTHVAGTAAGSGSLSASAGGTALQWHGMAPGADIISYGYTWNGVGMLFYNNPGDIENNWAAAQNTYGADLGSASLSSNIYLNYPASCALMGNYGTTSVLMDQIIRGGNSVVGTGDKYIATWAAGNERGSASSCGTYSTMSPPASAKNPIHVGASDKLDNMSTFSSWGPTDDGRIKPIVVATGVSIKSTVPNMFTNSSSRNCNGSGDDYCYPYDTMSGTSMATPAVAGSLALMLQHYRSVYATSGNFWPSTAKAILMQTAKDKGNAGPDYQWGYGLVDIRAAVDLITRRGFVQANVAQGEVDVYTFVVTDTALPAQVSLAWDDYEATFNANPTLINNLNLELVAPSGTLWRPWILNAAIPANNATRGVNNVDNQEQVTVSSPEKGTWLVRVRGTTVPQGPQDYALACQGCRALNAGVCQATAEHTPLLLESNLTAQGLALNSEGDEYVLQPAPAAPASAGEQWQRALEQRGPEADPSQRSPAQAPRLDGEQTLYTLIDPGRLGAQQDQIAAALREFDVARNAGPAAVIAFADRASDDVRAIVADEVADARASLDAPSAPAQSVSPAAPLAARVGVNGACAYNTVQDAINAAPNGATVRVMGDFFAESIDIAGGKVITIAGGYNATCTAIITGTTSRIDAVTTGSTVDVSGGSVLNLRNLVIGWGSSFGAGLDVLGSSHVTLNNTRLVHNNGASGGGIYIGGGSQVTLTNGSLVQYNTASSGGGAIVYGRLNGLDTGSDITGNCSTTNGGGVAVSGGTLYLNNADVHANQAAGATGRGGAIFATANAVVTLTTSSFIGESAPCCNIAYDGAGIYAEHSSIFSLGGNATILQNHATDNGGGLYLANGSLFQASSGTNVGYDVFAANGNTAVLGGGAYAISSTVDFDGRLINNVASNSGGGLYATASFITMTNATIGDPGANRQNQIGPSGLNGAGLYLINNTQATLSHTVIASNTLSNPATGYGGGAYVRDGSVLTMINSRIERHFLPSIGDGRGAGLYIYNATVTLSNTQVQSNTTNNLGAGARLFGTSTLNVMGGSAFVNDRALGGAGGAIAATNTPDINVADATFQSNSATTDGGAIYLDGGTLDFTGQWDVRFNHANGNGGAVAVLGTGDADLRASTGMSYLAVNSAGGNGGALYVTNGDTVQLYAADGYQLNLNTNSSGGNGGAAYANSGAFFDVYGQVQATSNNAGSNGGVFFLGGGSTVWFDDLFTTRPQIWVNTADNGGAVYASNSPRVECDGADFGAAGNGNRATAGSGGAIYLSGSTLLADNCVFRNNQAQAGNGGAVAAYTSTVRIDTDYATLQNDLTGPTGRAGPNALLATLCNPLTQQCSSLSSNRAISSTTSNGNGGAIYVNASSLSLNNTYLHRNTAVRGGAIYQENSSARGWISNTLVYSNTSLLPSGAGIRYAGGAMTLTHVTAANNVGGAGFSPGAASGYVYNTIIWGNSVAAFGALAAASCNIDQGGTAGPASNPLFVSPGGGENYHLQLGSPARDACNAGLPMDLDNTPRPYGSKYDMGAYEYTLRRIYLPLVVRQ